MHSCAILLLNNIPKGAKVMKFSRLSALALVLVLAVLFSLCAFAEGESADVGTSQPESSADAAPAPSGHKMSYGYKKLQAYDGATPVEYVTGQTPPTTYVAQGGSYTVSDNYYKYNDYVFAGWSCGGKIYQPGEKIYNVSSSMTFIATWARGPRPDMVVHGIVSYSEGGVITDTVSVKVGGTVTVKDGTWLDASGRVFKGGSKFLLSATTADFTAGTAPANAVSVKYSGATSGIQCGFTIEKGASFIVDGCYEERSGYTFTGWQSGDRVYLAGDTCVAEKDTVLTAIWRENTKPAPDYCTVNISVGEGGTATPTGKSTVVKGESFTFSVKADDYYALSSVICDGNELGTGGTYTITVRANVDISVSFKELEKPVSSEAESSVDDISVEASKEADVSEDSSADNEDKTDVDGKGGISRKAIAVISASAVCVLGVALSLVYSSKSKKRR